MKRTILKKNIGFVSVSSKQALRNCYYLAEEIKRTALLLLTILFISITNAQVQIKPLPKDGYDQRIRQVINQLKVVDSHEHLRDLANITSWRFKGSKLDFMFLFISYACDDIQSAGLQQIVFSNQLMTDSLTVKEKWKIIKPYWEGSSNTAYNRAVLLAADKLFGVKNIDSSTVEELSDKIRLAYQDESGWFNHVLKEKCGIEYVVADDFSSLYDPKIFRRVKRFDNFIAIYSKSEIENLTKWGNTGINSLDDLVSALATTFQDAMLTGNNVGIKSGLAYGRILFYDNVKKEKAEEVFNKILNAQTRLSFDEAKPLQDYMMHKVLDLADANNMPVQIHTGLLAGNGNIIENSKPTHLVNLFQEYPNVKFILFHGAYPYGGELSTLAKNFRNVYIDMCWMYVISPTYSERYLHEWLETVPANKIMAFGGDYLNIEGVYSHLMFAKQVISNVLISKVKDGYFTEDEATKIARMILHDNAINIFKIGTYFQ